MQRDASGEPRYYYYHWVFPTTYLQYAGKGFDIGSVQRRRVDRIRFRHIVLHAQGHAGGGLEPGQRALAGDADDPPGRRHLPAACRPATRPAWHRPVGLLSDRSGWCAG